MRRSSSSTRPSAFYGEFARRLGPVLADQLDATLDDRPLTLRCLEQRFEVSDHLVCEFLFQTDWRLKTGVEHNRLDFHDRTYDREQGRVPLEPRRGRGGNGRDRDAAEFPAPGSLTDRLAARRRRTPADRRGTFSRSAARPTRGASSPPVATENNRGLTTHRSPNRRAPTRRCSTLLDAPTGSACLLLLATAVRCRPRPDARPR